MHLAGDTEGPFGSYALPALSPHTPQYRGESFPFALHLVGAPAFFMFKARPVAVLLVA